MKRTEIAWAAGFFDGEECIKIMGSFLELRIAQKKPEPLYKFQSIFPGGMIRHYTAKRNGEVYCYYRIGATLSRNILLLMLPYLVAKRDEAIHAIDISNHLKYKRDISRMQLIVWYKSQGYTFEQIGELLNITRQRVQQLFLVAKANNIIPQQTCTFMQQSF